MKLKASGIFLWLCCFSVAVPITGNADDFSWLFDGGGGAEYQEKINQEMIQKKKDQWRETQNPADDPQPPAPGPPGAAPGSDSSFVFGVHYVGGRQVALDGNQENRIWVEQSTVFSFIPPDSLHPPVVMVPGMGLSGSMYMTTPDGRKGWAQIFAEAGYPVYVYEIPEYSTSGGYDVNLLNEFIDPFVHNEAYFEGVHYPAMYAWLEDPNQEVAVTVGKKGGGSIEIITPAQLPATTEGIPSFSIYTGINYNRWIGTDDLGDVFPDIQFPLDAASISQFERSFPYRWNDSDDFDYAPMTGDLEAENLIPLYELIGRPYILMGHSMGAKNITALLRAEPEAVRAVIAYEPAGMVDVPRGSIPGDADYEAGVQAFIDLLGDKPYLTIYGDYVAQRGHLGRQEAAYAVYDALAETGRIAGKIDLPVNYGIYGNTHMLSQDLNNDIIAGLLIEWLDANVE